MASSRSKLVKLLLYFQPIIVCLWGITPKFFSLFLLDIFRNSNSKIGFILRYLSVKRLAKKCGKKVIIFPGVYLKNIQNLVIGTNVSIHELTYIDAFGLIEIGNDVAISHNVSIVSFDHDISNLKIKSKDADPIGGKIIIQGNVWIGAGVRILKDSKIGEGSIIGSGAVVNSIIPKCSIAVGVPAKVIKHR